VIKKINFFHVLNLFFNKSDYFFPVHFFNEEKTNMKYRA